MKKFIGRLFFFGALLWLLNWTGGAASALSFGPYTVTRTLPFPPGGIGDLEFAGGYLYSVEDYDGDIHRLDPMTGQELASWSVPGASLHDGLPFDVPGGLAWDGNNVWMATRAPNYLRKLSLQTPPDASVDAIYTMPGWPEDLAYGNGLLMYPEYLGPIRKVDPATGAEVGSIPSPSPYVYSLTFDGQNLLAGMGLQGDDTLWVVSPQDGSIIDTWHTGIGGMIGLAFDLDSRSLDIGYLFGITVAQVPEPGTLALLIVGGVMLCARNRARRIGTGLRVNPSRPLRRAFSGSCSAVSRGGFCQPPS